LNGFGSTLSRFIALNRFQTAVRTVIIAQQWQNFWLNKNKEKKLNDTYLDILNKQFEIDKIDIVKMKILFDEFDESRDGTISKREFAKAMKSLCHKKLNSTKFDDFVQFCFERIDVNGNGEIDFDEFLGGMSFLNKILQDEESDERIGVNYANLRKKNNQIKNKMEMMLKNSRKKVKKSKKEQMKHGLIKKEDADKLVKAMRDFEARRRERELNKK